MNGSSVYVPASTAMYAVYADV